MATFGDERERDEVKLYQTGRYISCNEVIWIIFGFDIHHTPAISNSGKSSRSSRKWVECKLQ